MRNRGGAQPGEPIAARRRRARFRAWRRGTREADLLLGGFADAHIHAFDEHDLAAFERLMELPDGDLVDWISGRAPAPPEHSSPLLAAIVSFYRRS